MATLTFSSDIYSFGMSFFEIMSNFYSPWEKTIPICCDELVKDALLNGKRPGLEVLNSLYPDEKISVVIDTIKKCWHEMVEERPTVFEVNMHNYFYLSSECNVYNLGHLLDCYFLRSY